MTTLSADWLVDCPTFLRLTSTTLGKDGLHVIGRGGVTYYLDEAYVTGNPSPEAAACDLESIENASLPFPTTVARLINWVERQDGYFSLPPWLLSAAGAGSSEGARAILENEQAELRADLVKGKANAIAAATAAADPKVFYTFATSDNVSKARAIASLLKFIPAAVGTPIKRSRSDRIAAEIKGALKELGADAGPAEVMHTLQTYAGKRGSCIVDHALGRVIWQRDNGELESLTVVQLKARLSRLRNKLLKAGPR